MISKIKNRLWGYDFFISYHWASGGAYAVQLAQQLRERGFEVFLDRSEYAMGDDWQAVGEVALRNTRRLVLVATREAVFDSFPVEREILLFTDRNSHIVPIFFEDTFAAEEKANPGKHLVLERLPDATLYIEDSLHNLVEHGPSAEVVQKLISTHRTTRTRQVRRMATLVAMALLLAFSVAAGVSRVNAILARDAAIDARNTAIEKEKYATKQEGIARSEQQKALSSEREAYGRLADTFWQQAFTARDYGKDEFKAALLFAEAAVATEKSDKPQHARSALLAIADHDRAFLHDGPVLGAVFSGDESRVLTWSSDNTARLWDTTQDQPLRTFKHDGPVNGAVFSGDESRVLTWSDDHTARLWTPHRTSHSAHSNTRMRCLEECVVLCSATTSRASSHGVATAPRDSGTPAAKSHSAHSNIPYSLVLCSMAMRRESLHGVTMTPRDSGTPQWTKPYAPSNTTIRCTASLVPCSATMIRAC